MYGENEVPFVETMPLLPTTNPYGETKAISERIRAKNNILKSTVEFGSPADRECTTLIYTPARNAAKLIIPA